MISRLRRKFIIIAMLSVTAVLFILIASINIFNFNQVIRDADDVLNILTDNNGEFPADSMSEPKRNDPPGDRGNMRDGGRGKDMSPEMKYEARFFTVSFDDDGNTVEVDTGRIAAIDSVKAEELAGQVLAKSLTKGFKGDYRYRMSCQDDRTLIVFYDCGRSLDNARSFLWISITVSLAGLLVVFALIALSSKAVIRPAAEAYEKQKRFITDAGHELKTPLAVINADCDVLEMENADTSGEWLADIRKQTERLTELTNNLIYLAKTEEGTKSSMLMIDFPLSDIVSEEVESFKGPARSSGLSVMTDISPDITYNGDQRSLTQLVTILMDNAVKYSPDGRAISVSLHKNGSKTVLAVSNDTKEPVTKENMKHMFDRFYRTDASRNSETGGYGIGLSIAKGITESHNGKIYASGNGNRITVTVEL